MNTLRMLSFILAGALQCLRAQGPDPSSFSLTSGDVTEAIISPTVPVSLKVMLTREKSAELSAFTERNLNRQGRIVVAGKLRAEPYIRERMAGPALEIYVTSSDDALATIKALLTSARPFEQLATWVDASGRIHYADQLPPPAHAQSAPTGQMTEAGAYGLLKELEGSWQVIRATMNGKESGDRVLLDGQWRFERNQLAIHSPDKGTVQFNLKIDAAAEPKALYVSAIEPGKAGPGWMLYAREGKTLKIAFHDNLEGRPVSFQPRELGAKPALIVLTLGPKN